MAAARTYFKGTVNIPSPEELYLANREEIVTADSGTQLLHDKIMHSLLELFNKLRLRNLDEVALGESHALHEFSQTIKGLLLRIKRDEPDPHARLTFSVTNDNGPFQRKVEFDIGREQARLTVIGVAPKDGIDGFVREKGSYAALRRARKESKQIDHYTTGEFAQAVAGEVLAVIDNTRIYGTPGIDVRGTTIKPRKGVPFAVGTGEGVERRETASGKVQLIALHSGLVKTSYDHDERLRSIEVVRDIRLGEVGFRSGGHVMANGAGGGKKSLSIDTAEFKSVPPAFEARTEGLIVVKELVQGKVFGAEITAEMVNQGDGKYMVATGGGITINRSLQGGTLFAPEIIIGNGRVAATLMNGRLHARNRLVARRVILSGHSRLLMGNDVMREEQGKGKGGGSCSLSGRDLFRGRSTLKSDIAVEERDLRETNEKINKFLVDHIRKKAEIRRPLDHDKVRSAMQAFAELDRQYSRCSHEEEEELRAKITTLLYEIELDNVMPVIRLLSEKKRTQGQLSILEGKLEEMTQPIELEFELAQVKEGASIDIRCWQDTLRLRRVERELLLERGEKRLLTLPVDNQEIALHFDYESEKLELEDPEREP